MKRFFSLVLILALTLALLPVEVQASQIYSGTCGVAGKEDSVTWELTLDGVLTISGTGAMRDYSALTRDYSEGYSPWAFRNDVVSIVIEDGVTAIGKNAFLLCENLTDVTIPASLTAIGEDAFDWCGNLSAVHISDMAAWCGISFASLSSDPFSSMSSNPLYRAQNLYLNGALVTDLVVPRGTNSIGRYAFCNYSKLTSVTVLNGATSIGEHAFIGCENLKSVTLPDSMVTIGNAAFCACDGLTSVTIPDSVTAIGDGAFKYCSSLTDLTIGGGVTSMGENAFSDCGMLTDLTLRDGITCIGKNAFAECYSLTGVAIPDSVTTIGTDAFYCCNLTDVAIPASVTSIGDRAFGDSGLTRITVSSENQTFVVQGGALIDKQRGRLIVLPAASNVTAYTVPDGVTSICNYAFRHCKNLTSVTLPDSLTSIGDHAFASTGLTDVTIPASVTSIGTEPFSYCRFLKNITVSRGSQNFSVQNGALIDEKEGRLINFPAGSAATACIVPDTVTSIGDYAFAFCEDLERITLPDSLTTIGKFSFESTGGLTSIIIPDQVTTIGEGAFWCSHLTNVTLPASLNDIEYFAFDGTDLTDVYYTGDPTQWAAIAIGESNDPLTSAAIHYNYAPTTGNLGNGGELSWTYHKSTHELRVAGSIPEEELVLVGLYGKDGRFVGVKCLSADQLSAQLGDPASVKLFWVDGGLAPQCAAATVEN